MTPQTVVLDDDFVRCGLFEFLKLIEQGDDEDADPVGDVLRLRVQGLLDVGF